MNLDQKDFKSNAYETHKVRYFLYPNNVNNVDKFGIPNNISKRSGEDGIVKHGSTICFAHLLSECRKNKKSDMLVYSLYNGSIALTGAEAEEWLDICVKAKALPDYIKEISDIEGNRYILKIDTELNISILYIYLTCIRWIQEAPTFVKNMLKLVNKYNINFYIAWLIASKMSIGNTWHNIVSYGSDYGQTISSLFKESTYDVAVACGIKNLLLNPSKFGSKHCLGSAKNYDFEASEGVNKAKPKLKGKTTLNIKQVTDDELNKAMDDKTTKSLEALLIKIL